MGRGSLFLAQSSILFLFVASLESCCCAFCSSDFLSHVGVWAQQRSNQNPHEYTHSYSVYGLVTQNTWGLVQANSLNLAGKTSVTCWHVDFRLPSQEKEYNEKKLHTQWIQSWVCVCVSTHSLRERETSIQCLIPVHWIIRPFFLKVCIEIITALLIRTQMNLKWIAANALIWGLLLSVKLLKKFY